MVLAAADFQAVLLFLAVDLGETGRSGRSKTATPPECSAQTGPGSNDPGGRSCRRAASRSQRRWRSPSAEEFPKPTGVVDFLVLSELPRTAVRVSEAATLGASRLRANTRG
jgi:hypothetical protein